MCKMNCVYIKLRLKVESLKTELLKVSPPVPCGVVCVGVCLMTQRRKEINWNNIFYIGKENEILKYSIVDILICMFII
jgi:hypothetical protein